jgi:hypothetical protein
VNTTIKSAENSDYCVKQFWNGVEYWVVLRYKHIGEEWLFDVASDRDDADHLLALVMDIKGIYSC